MAKKIWNPAAYERLQASGTTPPPHVMLSGFYHSAFGYRVVRPRGAGSWLLFYTVAGTGLLRQPGSAWPQKPGDVALLAPDAFSDYGVASPQGKRATPLVSAASASRYASRFPFVSRKWRSDPTRRFTRWLHLDPRRPWPASTLGWRFHWIHFQPRRSWDSWLRFGEAGQGMYLTHVRSLERRARIAAAFGRIHRDLLSGRSAGEALAATALEEVLLLAGMEAEMEAGKAAGKNRRPLDPRIVTALENLEQDLAGEHSVAQLARIAGLSPSRFAHLFKAQTGTTVTQAVIRLRMTQARRMLAHSAERISEIAYALGYCSPYYFSQQFKTQLGLSPKAFRRKANQQQ